MTISISLLLITEKKTEKDKENHKVLQLVLLSHTYCWTPGDGPVPSRAGCGSSVAVEAVPWPRASIHPQELIQLTSALMWPLFHTELKTLGTTGPCMSLYKRQKNGVTTLLALVAVSYILGSVCVTSALYFMHESGETNSLYSSVNHRPPQPSEEHLFTARKMDTHGHTHTAIWCHWVTKTGTHTLSHTHKKIVCIHKLTHTVCLHFKASCKLQKSCYRRLHLQHLADALIQSKCTKVLWGLSHWLHQYWLTRSQT